MGNVNYEDSCKVNWLIMGRVGSDSVEWIVLI